MIFECEFVKESASVFLAFRSLFDYLRQANANVQASVSSGRLVDKLVANLVDNSGQKPVKMLH